jgi:hypothetical protein
MEKRSSQHSLVDRSVLAGGLPNVGRRLTNFSPITYAKKPDREAAARTTTSKGQTPPYTLRDPGESHSGLATEMCLLACELDRVANTTVHTVVQSSRDLGTACRRAYVLLVRYLTQSLLSTSQPK